MSKYLKIFFAWFAIMAGLCFIADVYASAILSPPGRPSIGGAVINGTDNSVLFVNPTGALNQDAGVFTYVASTGLLSAPDMAATNLGVGLVHSDANGLFTSSLLVDVDVDAAAAIQRTKLASGTAHAILINDGTGAMSSVGPLTNGQLLIGSTGAAATTATLTGTTDQVNVATGAGSITLSTPQSIATTSNVTFNTVTATSSLSTPNIKSTIIGGLLVEALGGTDVVSFGAGGTNLSIFQGEIYTKSSLTLEDPSVGVNSVNLSAFSGTAAYSLVFPLSAPTINSHIKYNGSGVGAFNQILGTSSQVIVTENSSNTTLSLPQSIATSSSPTFTGLTVTGLTANRFALVGGSDQLTDDGAFTYSTGSSPQLMITGTTAPQILLTGVSGGATASLINNSAGLDIGYKTASSLPLMFYTNNVQRAKIEISGDLLLDKSLKLEQSSAGTGYVGLKAPATVSSPYDITLPNAAPTDEFKFLKSDSNTGATVWGDLVYSQTFSTNVVGSQPHQFQSHRYTGITQNLASIDVAGLPDGARITVINTGTNVLTIPPTAGNVVYQNGTKILNQYQNVTYEYISASGGLVEVQ